MWHPSPRGAGVSPGELHTESARFLSDHKNSTGALKWKVMEGT